MPVSPESTPTARALRVLDILHSRTSATAEEIAERLGVTERAARRYVATLREAGIPVESSRGPYGGYRLGRGARLPPVRFTQAEALSLVMAVLDGQPSAGDLDDPVGSSLTKVIRALPEGVGREAAALREHAATAPDRHAARPDPAITSALIDAVAGRRRSLLRYRNESGREWDAEVDPWAVVVRYGRWYLLCHSHRADATRTYRIDRIQSVDRTAHLFRAPERLDPVATLEEHLGVGWEFPTRVVFEAPVDEVARWVPSPMGRLEASEKGCVLTGSTSNPAMYAQEWLARVPLPFRVEGGPELREAVASVVSRLGAALEHAP